MRCKPSVEVVKLALQRLGHQDLVETAFMAGHRASVREIWWCWTYARLLNDNVARSASHARHSHLPMISPFLGLPTSDWVASNDLAFAIRDRFPVSPGHTLVVPRRLVATYFEATAAEKAALWALVDEVKVALDQRASPRRVQRRLQRGGGGGTDCPHLHIHVIPRSAVTWTDPRGGVRHVIPGRAATTCSSEAAVGARDRGRG